MKQIIFLVFITITLVSSCAPSSNLGNADHLKIMLADSIDIYEKNLEFYTSKDFDGYDDMLAFLHVGPFAKKMDDRTRPDLWLDHEERMKQIGSVKVDDRTLIETYKQVLVLENYFSNKPRACESAGTGIDDVILLSESRLVDLLNKIIYQRGVAKGNDVNAIRRELVDLCNTYGYTLTAYFWTNGDILIDLDRKDIQITNSLRHVMNLKSMCNGPN